MIGMNTMLASVDTGDNTIIWVVILGIIAAALLVFYFIRKRKK